MVGWLDIAIAVIDLIQELTDVDALTESEEGAQELIDTLVCIRLETPCVYDENMNLGGRTSDCFTCAKSSTTR